MEKTVNIKDIIKSNKAFKKTEDYKRLVEILDEAISELNLS